ncbi:helix-turn-helix domain-containing protein [Ruegeria profundi]|uniref:HTH cro/C1-type domain-containing protein n=1 Tax=Ruegeria profundi TaxID=1685378 RepID=A0A0X3TZ90_9RHOB|nr:helix-turn-helix domain-containing protein [Ruegeria profundi]KUJ80972.1 hypothetical protein AVO44_03590 [Ruegeria profundi]
MTESDPSLLPADTAQGAQEKTSSFAEASPLEVREKVGLTISEMAELIGMSEFGYRMWEQETRRPGGPAYKLLALLNAHPKETISRLQQYG